MHYWYVIYSQSLDRYYVGETPDLQNRIAQHQNHYLKKGFTNAANDWQIVLSKKCNHKADAIFLEKFIKRMKSKKFISKIINEQHILEDILNRKDM